MANNWGVTFLFLSVFVPKCLSFGFFDDAFLDTNQCNEVCKNTYPLHTYEKTDHLSCCFRGCRLFNIIEFVNDSENVNATKDSCAFSCREAYDVNEDAAACYTGCDSQTNVASKRPKEQMVTLDPNVSPFYPFLYVHSLYSNMIDKFNDQLCVRWSFYIQSDSGSMLVVKSEPKVIGMDSLGDDSSEEYKTSNYLETNLAAVDNSATPNFKHSQMGPQQGYDMVLAKDENTSDWLSCVANKTGLPRMLLSLTIFVSAVMMIWLCFTTAATAPEHHIMAKPQKLSIYGDLEYLTTTADGQKLLTSMHPQDKCEAAPLPLKIQVHRL